MLRHFSDIVHQNNFNVNVEYQRLHKLFFDNHELYIPYTGNRVSVYKVCKENFKYMLFDNTCISLDDFNKTYGFNFEIYDECYDIDYLILFCEYIYNLLDRLNNTIVSQKSRSAIYEDNSNEISRCAMQVLSVVKAANYTSVPKNNYTCFVPKDEIAVAISEDVPELSQDIMFYSHQSLKHDLSAKRDILCHIANYLDNQERRQYLKSKNGSLEHCLYPAFNNLYIRHNNIEPNDKQYNEVIAKMSEDELESCYDDVYQLSLEALNTLRNKDRLKRIERLAVK